MGLIINPRQIIKDGITSLRNVWSSSKVSAELSGKQATLVSGINIKTINNTSLLGSGDITISGGGDIPKINMTATTATLDPNKFYVWGEVASLDISLAAETAGIENVYKFQFQSGAIATTLTLPSNVEWSESNTPTILDHSTYVVSILTNIATIDRMYRTRILPPQYQQVEWIKSTGTQYINLNLTGYSNYTMSVDMQADVNEEWGFGCRYRYLYKNFGFANGVVDQAYDKALCLYDNHQDLVTALMANDGQRHTYTIDRGTFKIDNTIIATYTENSFDTETSLHLFGIYDTTEAMVRFLSTATMYNAEVKNDELLLSKVLPCYRKSDNVAGMYDIVRDVFLTNAGSGSFIVGPDV